MEEEGGGEETPGVGEETPGVEDRERSGEGMFPFRLFPFHLLPSHLGGRSLFTLQQFPVHYQSERER